MKRLVCWIFALACTLACAGPTRAGQVFGAWNYAIDAGGDGSGGPLFEDRGLATSVQGANFVIAISSGMPLGGTPEPGALNNSITQGDLFLNFSGHNLNSASKFTDLKVFGIRFDSANDSLGNTLNQPNSALGVYGNLSVASLATQNLGYSSLQQYIDYGYGRTSNAMGDLKSTSGDVATYLGTGAMITSITGGTQLGGINLLDRTSLTALGLDFGHFGADPAGNNVYGLSFNRSVLGITSGSFMLHEFLECINDGVALSGNFGIEIPITNESVSTPEPSTLGGAILAGLIGIGVSARKRSRLATV